MRRGGGRVVYGNGEQVATVADRLDAGSSPLEALDGPDFPLRTPRHRAPVTGRTATRPTTMAV
ncbi:hypothetical protein [Kitasatospora phosalacinea]|uniref:Uncharacterized protein n=1 Tax=Kitasatospora phosalacinea TaxID=2065 RepID=A0A9W6UQY0_9ACTN|nr:hypothetical protein [Kitasatospora phosalacinea]GLW56010.1 hypothetical protein Kpho01_40210 [Kitasatospora phosalacinea]